MCSIRVPRIQLLSVLVGLVLAGLVVAEPPPPPVGYRWVIQPQFSDEFDGDTLDQTKWRNTFADGRSNWLGRPPAYFLPEAVSVADGTLQIRGGVLEEPRGPYTMHGGAVSSRTYDAHFGYYECRALASKLKMSTTFWLSSYKRPFGETADNLQDTYSQELDIMEAVGGSEKHPEFTDHMKSNTHFRHVPEPGAKEVFYSKGAKGKLRSKVTDEFHTYGAWWQDARQVRLYADDEFFAHIEFNRELKAEPFEDPMKINFVVETYNWQPPPSPAELVDDSINTAYYEWVRSYRLVPVDQPWDDNDYPAELYREDITVDLEKSRLDLSTRPAVRLSFKTNQPRSLKISLAHGKNNVAATETIPLPKGYGTTELPLAWMSESAASGQDCHVLLQLEGENNKVIKRISLEASL